MMTGRFDFNNNCSILNFIPQGEQCDGLPVIIFPKDSTKMVHGKTYEFEMVMTREATYVIDGQEYRVAHAVEAKVLYESHGGVVDVILYSKKPGEKVGDPQLGDVIAPKIAERLATLRDSLPSQTSQS